MWDKNLLVLFILGGVRKMGKDEYVLWEKNPMLIWLLLKIVMYMLFHFFFLSSLPNFFPEKIKENTG